MRVVYVIESRTCERAPWEPWPLVTPLSCRADAEAQATLLQSREPMPTRDWMAYREFRAVERPAGCGKCFEGAIGSECEWHKTLATLGATIDAPRPLPVPKPVTLSPKVRRTARSGYGADAIARLRKHQQGGDE